ncbi:MAG: prepilin peptidase [Porphyrobacter sp.]|jgi:leader peptidase (prepilin peptidase)/N-methyltransferase|nr:prepilin peptidase [Porphyrobacter sp.]
MSEWPTGLIALFAGLAGAAVGSFVGTALVRLPEGRSVLSGHSACDSCGTRIAARDMVPLLSWLLLRGRCRNCNAPIGVWQVGCEIAGALIGVAAVLLAPERTALPAMLFGWQLLLLALIDVRHFWLPRPLTAVLAASGAGLAIWQGWSEASLVPLGVAAAGGALGFIMLWGVARGYRLLRGRDGMGDGDPPLLAAIGLWLGPMGVIGTVIGASVLGLASALVMLLARRPVTSDTAMPLGTLMAASASAIFLINGGV